LRKLIANVLIPIILILTVFAPLTIGNTSVFAEGVGVVLSSSHSSIEAGGSFSITASATTQLPIGNYVVEITYDPNLVRYDGFSDLVGMSDPRANASSGKVRVVAVGSEVTAASLCKFNFTALTPGSSAITVSYAEVASEFPPAGSSASISIIPPKSGNANLASLAVDQGTLRPSFSPGTQNYTLPVAMGVSQINITAKAEDSKALSVQVSGNTGLRDGANTIKNCRDSRKRINENIYNHSKSNRSDAHTGADTNTGTDTNATTFCRCGWQCFFDCRTPGRS
jgi:hypothetical protein